MFSITEAAGHLTDVSKETTTLQSKEGKYYRSLTFKEKPHLLPPPQEKKKKQQKTQPFDKLLALNIVFQFLGPNITGRAGNFLLKRIIMISLITFSVQNQGAALSGFLNPKGPLYLQESMSKYWTLLNLFD